MGRDKSIIGDRLHARMTTRNRLKWRLRRMDGAP
jgi:hypothetical protein